MTAFQRLSPGPTVPDLMEAEWDRLLCRLRGQACLAAASAVLLAARLLLWLRVVEPAFAAGAFGLATRLGRAGTWHWQRGRPRVIS